MLHMAAHLDDEGGCFVQAESELGAVNMGLGAAASGGNVMCGVSVGNMALRVREISAELVGRLEILIKVFLAVKLRQIAAGFVHILFELCRSAADCFAGEKRLP